MRKIFVILISVIIISFIILFKGNESNEDSNQLISKIHEFQILTKLKASLSGNSTLANSIIVSYKEGNFKIYNSVYGIDFLSENQTLINTQTGVFIHKKKRELIILMNSFSKKGFVTNSDYEKIELILNEIEDLIYVYKNEIYEKNAKDAFYRDVLNKEELDVDTLESLKMTEEEVKKFNSLIINNNGTINLNKE